MSFVIIHNIISHKKYKQLSVIFDFMYEKDLNNLCNSEKFMN